MKFFMYVTNVCLLLFVAHAQAQQDPCPPCLNHVTPWPERHGQTQGRINLTVYLEPQGWDSDFIRMRVQNAVACANERWNIARGIDINTTIPYFFQVTTEQIRT